MPHSLADAALAQALVDCARACGRMEVELSRRPAFPRVAQVCRDAALLCRLAADLLRRQSSCAARMLPVVQQACRTAALASDTLTGGFECAEHCRSVDAAIAERDGVVVRRLRQQKNALGRAVASLLPLRHRLALSLHRLWAGSLRQVGRLTSRARA
jgi:hypothetical protein